MEILICDSCGRPLSDRDSSVQYGTIKMTGFDSQEKEFKHVCGVCFGKISELFPDQPYRKGGDA